MDAKGSPRFLISRLSAVGDCILTTPLACALRKHFPDAFIAWVVQGGAAGVLEGHPAIDRVVVVKKGWMRSPQEVARLRQTLRSLQFDVSLDPQSLTKSAVAAWLSGAPRRIGFARPTGRELATLLNNQTVAPSSTHVVDCYLELLHPLGVALESPKFEIPVRPAAARSIGDFVEAMHLQGGYAVVNPGAGWESKLWPAERFGKVARFLGEQASLPSVVVWSGERERQWAETIVARSGGNAFLAPSTTLPQLGALVAQTRLFVGSDTGPLHLAASMGAPCVGLYGPTRPEVCGPYGEGHQTVQAFYQDGSSRQRRGSDNRAMQAITVEAVCDACWKVLHPARAQAA